MGDALLKSLYAHHSWPKPVTGLYGERRRNTETTRSITDRRRDEARQRYELIGVRVQDIVLLVCRRYEIGLNELLSLRRSKELWHARYVGFYLARELTRASFPQIGKHFNRDHSSVLVGAEVMAKRLATDPELRAEVGELFDILTGAENISDTTNKMAG